MQTHRGRENERDGKDRNLERKRGRNYDKGKLENMRGNKIR
jgi:hypothetical protein